MLQAIRKRIFTPAGAIAVVALVLAMTGAAFAASGALSGKQKKEVTKIAKKFAGKPGATGPAGTNGTNGEKGAQGLQGEKGEKGEKGDTGNTGSPGTSVTSTESASSFGTGHCDGTGNSGVGGSKFVAGASTTYACNGATGEINTEGPLPPGATETGAWTTSFSATAAGQYMTGEISFPIPLSAAPVPHYLKFGETIAGTCEGTAEAPTATTGNLCVYAALEINTEPPIIASAGNGSLAAGQAQKTGALVVRTSEAAGASFVFGSWAVTG